MRIFYRARTHAQQLTSCSAATMAVSRQEVINCSIPMWYPEFKSLTFESVFIPLSADFVEYLKSDGIILPQGCYLPTEDQPQSLDDSDNSSEEDDSDQKPPEFPAIVEKMETGITTLSGRVVPKLNWSTPRDASWLLPGNTLQCRTPGEVILLLKSSDFVAHDLIHVFDECKDRCEATPTAYTLCLRKWAEIHPSTEFRCFVRNNSLIAVSQREVSSCYRHLVTNCEEIRQEVAHFYQSHIKNKFPGTNYVFDVWRASEGDIQLVDFNPFCSKTDSLLFSWEELASGSVPSEGGAPVINTVIRVVENEAAIRPHDLQEYRYPQDALDLARGEDIHKLVDFLKLRKESEELEESYEST